MAISIAYIHIHNKPIVKTLHHVINVNSIEAELFAIRCRINQAITSSRISKIIIITDSNHTAENIFGFMSYPFQIYTLSILHEL